MRSGLRSVASFVPVAMLGACGGGGDAPKCIPGASVECACPNGQYGAQTCSADGTFAPCVCAPTGQDGGGLGGTSGADVPPTSLGTGGQQTGGAGGSGGDTTVGSCTGTPEYCVMYPTQTACQAVGCHWNNSPPVESCEGTGWPCSQFATKATCTFAGCTWLAGIPPAGSGGASGTGGTPGTGLATGAGGITGTGGVTSAGGVTGMGGRIDGGAPSTGGISGTGGVTSAGGVTGMGGRIDGGAPSTGGISGRGGATGRGGSGGTTAGGAGGIGGIGGTTAVPTSCGDGKLDPGERCDCGASPTNLPSGCKAPNGIFHGDGTGCTKTCTKEPSCLDATGKTQACTTACGDGNIDAGEACDDGNSEDGDGCSSACEVEDGFSCSPQTVQDAQPCASGSGTCLALSTIYRDFQGENVAVGGHPDFPFLGTRYGGTKPTTICVPISGGPAHGNDSTARCWGIAAESLLNGKPQPGPTTTCACQFSDWSMANSSRIPGGYTLAGNDSPLSDGDAGIQSADIGATVNTISTGGPYAGTLIGYTASSPGGPIWRGTAPAYKDAASFSQWFNDDPSVNQTFPAVREMPSIGSNIYQYASKAHLAQGGFYPLDALNPSQATLCNLWPYWNHGTGQPFWGSCTGDQYLFPPRVTSSDCVSGDSVDDGCWVTSVTGSKHDNYFTDEARYYFVYDSTNGISISFYGDDDLFIFINGKLVLDLGGIHQQLPGKVTVSGDPGDARVLEGGCLDAAGNIVGAAAGSTACSPGNVTPALQAATPADFRDRTVKLGLQNGKVYELAIFGADRHPPESNFQLTLQGFTKKRSWCQPN